MLRLPMHSRSRSINGVQNDRGLQRPSALGWVLITVLLGIGLLAGCGGREDVEAATASRIAQADFTGRQQDRQASDSQVVNPAAAASAAIASGSDCSKGLGRAVETSGGPPPLELADPPDESDSELPAIDDAGALQPPVVAEEPWPG